MEKFDSPLSNVKIASPCSADWEQMAGDERKRFCGDCKLNVYNLSGMTRYDAENLLRNAEGRLCVRYFQRADGTVLTKDCPVGWEAVKQRSILMATAALSTLLALFSGVLALTWIGREPAVRDRFELFLDNVSPEPAVMGNFVTPPPRQGKIKSTMGDIAPMAEQR